MNDKKILQIIKQLKELHAIDENELIVEDNFIFIPSIELIRDTDGKWISDISF